jgi:hypothetical protein
MPCPTTVTRKMAGATERPGLVANSGWRRLTATCSCQRGGGVFRSVRLNIHVGAGPRVAALQLKSIR